jgi:hypothetical protein
MRMRTDLFIRVAHMYTYFNKDFKQHLSHSTCHTLRRDRPRQTHYCLVLQTSFLRISLFLFLCAPLCAIYLEGYWLLLLPFLLQDHRFPTDLVTSCVKNWRN